MSLSEIYVIATIAVCVWAYITPSIMLVFVAVVLVVAVPKVIMTEAAMKIATSDKI